MAAPATPWAPSTDPTGFRLGDVPEFTASRLPIALSYELRDPGAAAGDSGRLLLYGVQLRENPPPERSRRVRRKEGQPHMFTPDDLAGVVDLFGALTREELEEALSELAYRRDEPVPEGAVGHAVDQFALVAVEGDAVAPADGGDAPAREDDGSLLAAGPAAFPALPEGAEDLPHILDVEPRSVDREAVGRAAESRLRSEAARAVADDDRERVAELLDVSYDLEAWAPVELDGVRDRLDDASDGTN